MGFFKKKADPISERARLLNEQIAALEAEIHRLSAQPAEANLNAASPKPPPDKDSNHRAASPQPRLRSTALPHGHSGATIHAAPAPPAPQREPVFEDVHPFRPEEAEARADLGVRGGQSPSWWERFKDNFRSRPASNPKLVNYLAAGSIQGLRPLRYEKRVARNRFLLFVLVLAVVLWGLVAVLLKR